MKKQTLGNMISTLRKEKGMTQLDLANQLNVTDKAVSKWERDLSYPDINSLPKLAEVLGVTVDELMQIKNEATQQNDKKDLINTVLKAVPLAMGVAVIVLSILNEMDSQSAFIMLGVGLACLAILELSKDKE